jgi:DNA-binding transcriptional LysR family regulator
LCRSSIGEHLGIARFGGLGELDAEQLAALPERAAVPLTSDALELARKAWAALRAPDPRGLAAIVTARSRVLRFLPEAFDRLSREYPSTRDGLSLTERRLLAAVADGAVTAADAFVRAAAREARPFLGDTFAFAALERVARASTPLVEARNPVERDSPVAVTDPGRAVLAAEADHVELNGVDRWVGGVHLLGRDVPRFDESLEAVVSR